MGTGTRSACALAVLVACAGVALATFLDEVALQELAEREGYTMTLHELQRVRRQATDKDECRCPPGPPPPPDFDESGMPPPPPPGFEPNGDGMRPPPGCFPPPFHHHMRPGDSKGPACELRPMFRVPEKFNFSARSHCFDLWERPTATLYGLTPEARRDFGKFKPWQRHSLLWNKGCDMQCLFSEMELLSGAETDNVAVDPDAVISLLSEEGDSSDISMAIERAVKSCMDSNAEMVHAKQVCRSGADELLFCLHRALEETCPGAKWQGQRSCDEVEDAATKLRSCHRRRRMHPHGPPPPGPPPEFGRPGPWRKFRPSNPEQDLQAADNAQASEP